jgi:hypothetical protein
VQKALRSMYPVEHMLVSARGLKWREIHLAMFTVYLDDSGTSPSQHVAIATAMIIPAAQIIRLEVEWDRLKRKEGFTSFHTSQFVAKNSKSEFANWDDEKRKRVFRRVREITKKYGTRAVSFAVCKEDYDQIVPLEVRELSGKHHYTWAIRHVITYLDEWKTRARIAPPFEYIFDTVAKKRTDERRVEVETVMEQAEELSSNHGQVGQFTNYTFRRLETLAGLQCADVLAWACYQYALYVFRDTPLSEFGGIAWHDFINHMGANNWLVVGTLTKENMRTWIAKEIADGRSMARFRLWKEKIADKKGRALGKTI